MFKVKVLGGNYEGVEGSYELGDIFATEKDLAKRWPEKFMACDPDAKVSPSRKAVPKVEATPTPADDFDKMTVNELRKFAEAEEIDLDNLTKKDDIIAHIREALAAK